MVPGQKFDKPGKSPFMNMDLVPVYADDAPATAGGVTISARAMQNLGIRLAEVKESRMQMGFSATGAASVDERTLSAVQARVNGYVEKLHVRAQYDNVGRGQPLLDIYSPEWLAAQEEYLVLRRSSQPDVTSIAQAARVRLGLLGVSEAQIQRIEQIGKPEPRVTLYAPEAGVVWEIGVREGMAVSPGMTLFRLASLGSIWVNAEVPETEAALLRPGMPVNARVAALPDMVYKGNVAAILPDVNAATRTIKARIALANPGGRLKPGMFATVEFGATEKSALTVPSEAVINTGKRTVIIVAAEGGQFLPVEVETGRDSGDMTEIRKGLAAGQKVVTSGQFLIDSESSLKTTLSRLQSSAPEAPAQAAGSTPTAQVMGSGKIIRIDAANGMLEISHGPIPALKWPAMTMMFRADKSLLASAKPGDEIQFEILDKPDKNGDYIITRLVPRKANAAPGKAK
jgi:Cu(I)/Ag(I) efflux system membrane fusion protein